MLKLITGGVWSNSLAIATDAAHLLTDFASFMISLFSLWVAHRPATKKMPFGWYRAEVNLFDYILHFSFPQFHIDMGGSVVTVYFGLENIWQKSSVFKQWVLFLLVILSKTRI